MNDVANGLTGWNSNDDFNESSLDWYSIHCDDSGGTLVGAAYKVLAYSIAADSMFYHESNNEDYASSRWAGGI